MSNAALLVMPSPEQNPTARRLRTLIEWRKKARRSQGALLKSLGEIAAILAEIQSELDEIERQVGGNLK